MTDNRSTGDSTMEQELGGILAFLNPPQQQYDILADRAWHFLSGLPAQPSLERALAVYFELFSRGYAEWQTCYDYHRIHEYFYGAYLKAIRECGVGLSSPLRDMLSQLTEAMIAYTWCENAVICNDPKGLSAFATRATECGEAALQSLAHSSLSSLLRAPIEKYLLINTYLFRGLKLCAEMFLDTREGEGIPNAERDRINESLAFLEANSRELFSELRAHLFAQRYARARLKRSSELRVKQADLLLRAIGYADEDLIAALFDVCTSTDVMARDTLRSAREETGLPIVAVRSSHLQDIFETSLGEEYLEEIIFELSSDDSAFVFLIRDGDKELPYSVEAFQIRVARLGTVSVEFGISIENASVSHVRVLESLISPHAGRFDLVWRDAPLDLGHGTTDFVDYFLRCQEWVKYIQQVMPGLESSTLAKMQDVLSEWHEALCELGNWLPRQFSGPQKDLSGPSERLQDVYRTLHACFLRMRVLAREWIQEQSTLSYPGIISIGEALFPPGVRFARLMDIVEEIFQRISRFLYSGLTRDNLESRAHPRANQTAPHDDARRLFAFDPNTGWQTILSCSRLTIVEPDGKESDPTLKLDDQGITSHPEFKGFIIQNREARSSFDDWLFVAMPTYRNLATIRSHETDAMYMGENRAFLYLPDEPQYLITQYIESVRLIGDIRTLVLTFNTNAKGQIEQLKSFLDEFQRTGNAWTSRFTLKKAQSLLLSRRNEIEVFRMSASKTLDLLRSCTISKYQDHSDLLRAMMQESSIDTFRESLERKIDILDRFHSHLTDLLQQKIDDLNHSNQRLLNWLLFVLTSLSGLSAVTALQPYLEQVIDGMMTKDALLMMMTFLLAGVVVGSVVTGLVVWRRSRNI